MPRPLRVFLCHASQDKPAVRALYKRLVSDGVDAWLDEEKLLPGQSWRIEIPQAVREADAIIICLSRKSITKEGYYQTEIKFALDVVKEKPSDTVYLIPAKLEECKVPYELTDWQWVNLSFDGKGFDEFEYNRLLRALKARAERVDATPPERRGFHLTLPRPQPITTPKKARAKPTRSPEKKIQPASPSPEIQEPVTTVEEPKQEPMRIETSPRVQPAPRVEKKVEKQQKPAPQFDFRWLGIGGVVLLCLVFGMYGINYLAHLPATPKPSPTAEVTSTFEPSTATPEPPTEPSTATLVPTPTLGIGSTTISDKDGMVMDYVPAGNFLMGSTSADSLAQSNEMPQHTVFLDAFWIDQTDVTNAMYAKCVADNGACPPPSNSSSYTHSSYYGNSQFDNYPVINVDWNNADTYCKWAGRQLPTEAQWEKAARGTDGRIYPWGNQAPSKDLLNYNQIVGDTTAVGSYPKGASPYGALDMAGNVWQWVADWYTAYPGNTVSDSSYGTTYRVLRGGSWNSSYYLVRSAVRGWYDPASSVDLIGFRCSRSP